MSDRDRLILLKIAGYINETLSYTKGLDFAAFSQDRKTINATAFVLGQIGELAKQISEEFQNATAHIYWRGIRGLRNRIVHDYENLDMNRLWEVIRDDLPILETQIQNLLK